MGTRFTVGGIDFNAADYSVTEDSTGLSLNDSSGGVGEVRVSVDKPSPEEIRDMPSPYPDAVTLTPTLPGYYEDPDDFVLTPLNDGVRASYEVVSVPPTSLGATRAMRLTIPAGGQVIVFPNGGARILGNQPPGSISEYAAAPVAPLRQLPPIRPRDPQTGNSPRIATTFIVQDIPDSITSGVFLTMGWPGDGVTASLGTLSEGLEYGLQTPTFNPGNPFAVPYLQFRNLPENALPVTIDLITSGVFALSEPAPGAWGTLFSGFVNPSGFVTSWDEGSPSGLASRYARDTPRVSPWVRKFAPQIFEGLNFVLEDSQYGRIPGRVEGVSETDDTWEFTCVPVLGLLNTQEVLLPPVEGTASQILREFVRQGASPWVPIYVEPELDSEILRLGRQQGELWSLMKQFSAGLGAEISVVDGVLILRKPRRFLTEPGRYFSRSVSPSNQDAKPGVVLESEFLSPAETETTLGVNVYPGGAVNQLLPVISAPGGESVEVDVPLGFEANALFVPSFQSDVRKVAVFDDLNAWVGDFYLNLGYQGSGATQQAIFARQLWLGNGWYRKYYGFSAADWSPLFSLSIERVPSADRAVRVTFQTPQVTDSDGRSRTFSLAGISGGAQVNGLRLFAPWGMKVGGMETAEFPTGSSSLRGDAPDVLYSKSVSWTAPRISSAGYAASRRASGRYRNLNGTVDRLRPPYESNYYSSAPYSDAQEFVGGVTYEGVVGVYGSVVSPVNYREIQRYWNQNYESSIKTWVFGNVAGARIWDEASNNFYRIRTATITPGGISFSAETDTVHGDVDPLYSSEGLTYSDVVSRSRDYLPLSYKQASASGYLKDPTNA